VHRGRKRIILTVYWCGIGEEEWIYFECNNEKGFSFIAQSP
jgi:hypothetical protein